MTGQVERTRWMEGRSRPFVDPETLALESSGLRWSKNLLHPPTLDSPGVRFDQKNREGIVGMFWNELLEGKAIGRSPLAPPPHWLG